MDEQKGGRISLPRDARKTILTKEEVQFYFRLCVTIICSIVFLVTIIKSHEKLKLERYGTRLNIESVSTSDLPRLAVCRHPGQVIGPYVQNGDSYYEGLFDRYQLTVADMAKTKAYEKLRGSYHAVFRRYSFHDIEVVKELTIHDAGEDYLGNGTKSSPAIERNLWDSFFHPLFGFCVEYNRPYADITSVMKITVDTVKSFPKDDRIFEPPNVVVDDGHSRAPAPPGPPPKPPPVLTPPGGRERLGFTLQPVASPEVVEEYFRNVVDPNLESSYDRRVEPGFGAEMALLYFPKMMTSTRYAVLLPFHKSNSYSVELEVADRADLQCEESYLESEDECVMGCLDLKFFNEFNCSHPRLHLASNYWTNITKSVGTDNPCTLGHYQNTTAGCDGTCDSDSEEPGLAFIRRTMLYFDDVVRYFCRTVHIRVYVT